MSATFECTPLVELFTEGRYAEAANLTQTMVALRAGLRQEMRSDG